MKRLAILGSTGSIGQNSLEVVSSFPGLFKVTALAAGGNLPCLAEQITKHRPQVVAIKDEEKAAALREMLPAGERPLILHGPEGYQTIAAWPEADMVISAISGAAGILPTMAAIEAGKDVALANKESLVMGGELIMSKARERRVRILPVDSEHSAIFQCLAGKDPKDVRKLILTASGGPFRRRSPKGLARVTVKEALRHPNWKMGRKITVDSASLMNKGLEIIEARWLFDVEMARIEVLIHPQSIVHSLVEYVDGAMLAQLGLPDMKVPIAFALSYPERLSGVCPPPALDVLQRLEFFPPDKERFPSLRLAIEAGCAGGTYPAVLNAANEVAVGEFLANRAGFMDIPAIIETVLGEHDSISPGCLEDLLAVDDWARTRAFAVARNGRNRKVIFFVEGN